MKRWRLLRNRLRRAWHALNGKREAFAGARTNRLLGDWFSTLMSPDDEIRWDVLRMRARARDLARNNPYVRQFLNLLKVNVVGPNGITLQARVQNNNREPNKAFNDKIERTWTEWGEAPTPDGRLSLVGLQQMLIASVARDGEQFVRLWRGFPNRYGFALEVLDPDLLDTEYNIAQGVNQNEIRMGIEQDEFGRPLAYWFWSEPVSGFGHQHYKNRIRVPADEIVHLYDPERASQSRGFPWLASVMVALHEVDVYQDTAVNAARVGAAQMAWFTRKDGAEGGEGLQGDEDNKVQLDVEPGQMGVAPDGYSIESWDPKYPNTEHGEFLKTELRRIATGLGVSYNALCNDLEGVNYSSIRAGLLIERDLWASLQRWWIDAFLTRVYREWLNMALLSGALVLDTRDFRKFLDVRWLPRGWAWVDPLKDTEAGIAGIQNGLASRTRLLAEQGLDIEEVFEDLRRENELAERLRIAITEPKPAAPNPGRTDKDGGEEEGDQGRNLRGDVRGVNRVAAALAGPARNGKGH